MSDQKQYGVLHEIGDYYQPKKLTEEDNKAINEQMNREDQNKRDKENK